MHTRLPVGRAPRRLSGGRSPLRPPRATAHGRFGGSAATAAGCDADLLSAAQAGLGHCRRRWATLPDGLRLQLAAPPRAPPDYRAPRSAAWRGLPPGAAPPWSRAASAGPPRRRRWRRRPGWRGSRQRGCARRPPPLPVPTCHHLEATSSTRPHPRPSRPLLRSPRCEPRGSARCPRRPRKRPLPGPAVTAPKVPLRLPLRWLPGSPHSSLCGRMPSCPRQPQLPRELQALRRPTIGPTRVWRRPGRWPPGCRHCLSPTSARPQPLPGVPGHRHCAAAARAARWRRRARS
mmetsp:Transcript_18367/g.64504  ORF Transcript_18367/g.64504 Transcript_18367/m.64504 type:complete len:290 (+) Transcript_18367:2-871(+)